MNEFEELTRTLIQTKLIEALKSRDDYIDSLVQAAFRTEVNEHGGKPDSWSRDKMPWLEWCTRHAIRKTTQSVVNEVVSDLKPRIEAAVRKSLTEDDIVSAFMKQVIKNTEDSFYVDVVVKPPEK